MYYLYRLLSYFIFSSLVTSIILGRRFFKHKETNQSVKEKTCKNIVQRPKSNLIWLHAASVGELKSAIPLIKHILKIQKCTFLVSTCTLTSAKLFESAGLKNCIHVFAPLDHPSIVETFLDNWKPDLGIFIDSELWPNLVVEASCRFKIFSVNTRLSDRSFKLWRLFAGLARFLLNRFTYVFPVSQRDYDKVSYFIGAEKVHYLGNLKDAAQPVFIKSEASTLRKKIKKKYIFLAASTHKGEDSEIIEAFLPFKKNFQLIIVPKHPNRSETIAGLLDEYMVSYSVRSKEEKPLGDAYIADTIGELDMFYSIADIAFVGGSMVPHGGQNFVEAARNNCLILIGPHTSNFRDLSDKYLSSNAAILVNRSRDIVDTMMKFSKSSNSYDKTVSNAKKLAKCNTEILSHLTKFILKK